MRMLRCILLAFALLTLTTAATASAHDRDDDDRDGDRSALTLTQPRERKAVRAMRRPAVVDVAELDAQLLVIKQRAETLRAALRAEDEAQDRARRGRRDRRHHGHDRDRDRDDDARARAQRARELEALLSAVATLEQHARRAPRLEPPTARRRGGAALTPAPAPSPQPVLLSDVAFAHLLSEIQRLPARDRLDRLRAEGAAHRFNAAQTRALLPLFRDPLRPLKLLYPALDTTADAHTFLHHVPDHQRAELLTFALQQPPARTRLYMSALRIDALKVLLTTLPEHLRADALRLALHNNQLVDAQRDALVQTYIPPGQRRAFSTQRTARRYHLTD